MDLREAVSAFSAACRSNPHVLAAFLGGSLAAGTDDGCSDLDLYVISDDGSYDALYAGRRRLIESMGSPVFLENVEHGFDMVVFILDSGIRGELALARRSGFGHIHGGPFETLHDPEGVLGGQTFPPWEPSPDDVREAVRRKVSWFWHDAVLLGVALTRRRPWTALGCLERMRDACLALWRLDADPFSLARGWDRLEDALHPPALDRWQQALPRAEPGQIEAAARAIVALLREKAPGLCERWAVDYPRRLEQAVTRLLPGDGPW